MVSELSGQEGILQELILHSLLRSLMEKAFCSISAFGRQAESCEKVGWVVAILRILKKFYFIYRLPLLPRLQEDKQITADIQQNRSGPQK